MMSWRSPGLNRVRPDEFTQAERHYHSTRMEPLGKCFSHGHVLPEECRTREHKFGKSTITPGGSLENFDHAVRKPVPGERAQYIKSHGSMVPANSVVAIMTGRAAT